MRGNPNHSLMKKILVIEDEPAMRANLRDILETEDLQPLLEAPVNRPAARPRIVALNRN